LSNLQSSRSALYDRPICVEAPEPVLPVDPALVEATLRFTVSDLVCLALVVALRLGWC
jgi:hypothetical protein